MGVVALKRLFPFLSWAGDIHPASLRADLISGVTVALVLIPQSMAYAQLAGLPPYYGLYAAFLPPVVAALFGSSRQLATGPVAIVSLMTAATLEPLATAGSEAFVAYAVLLALIVGLFQLALGVLRLGVIVNFLSHPVVTGFANAGAIIIATTQLGKIFGVRVESGEHHYETVYETVKESFRNGHLPTVAYGLLALLLMLVLRRISRRIPNVLAAVALATLVSWATGYECRAKAPLASVATPEVRTAIEEYDACVNRAAALVDEQRDLAKRLVAVEEGEAKDVGDEEVAALGLKHAISVNAIYRQEAGTACAKKRQALRDLRLEAVEGPDGERTFYAAGAAPAGAKTDGRSWRIVVGAGPAAKDGLSLSAGGAVVGAIPSGLPSVKAPKIDVRVAIGLIPAAIVIALLGFMEAISIAKAMAARTGQRLSPNQELIGQGLACIVGSFTRSYPVSGSFSRSAVNLQAGAVTGLSSVFASAVVLVTLLFLTPLLYHLPQAVLAAVIMMAVVGLVKPAAFVHAFRVHRHDGIVAVTTFVATLAFAPHLDRGIMIGVGLSLAFYLTRNMKPAVAVLSKHPDGSFRNADRWSLAECENVSVIRFNGSLIFANAIYLEDTVLEQVATMPHLRYVLIVGNGINEIDASGEDVLSLLVGRLRDAGYEVGISGLNDPMLDLLRRTHLYEKIGEKNLFRSVNHALREIHAAAHEGSSEAVCPLLRVVPRDGSPPPGGGPGRGEETDDRIEVG